RRELAADRLVAARAWAPCFAALAHGASASARLRVGACVAGPPTLVSFTFASSCCEHVRASCCISWCERTPHALTFSQSSPGPVTARPDRFFLFTPLRASLGVW